MKPFLPRTPTLPLSHLPLRPSSLELLTTRGFQTVQEVQESHQRGGLSNLASELGSSLVLANSIWSEVTETALQQQRDQSPQLRPHDIVDPNASVQGTTGTGTTPANWNRRHHYHQQHDQHNHHYRRPRTAQEILANATIPVANIATTETTVLEPNAIITFCRQVDQAILAGGVALGELTELCGAPGTGKTQWCMQLAVNAALPIAFGGVQGETIYIDTEGSFCPERCAILAQALIDHVQSNLLRRRRARQPPPGTELPVWDITVEQILRGIHVIRVHDESTLQATIEGDVLVSMIQQRLLTTTTTTTTTTAAVTTTKTTAMAVGAKPIRLIVIDSMAFPIRAVLPPGGEYPNMDHSITRHATTTHTMETGRDFFVTRARILTNMARELGQLATNYRLAVLVTNQMTTKPSGQLVPALGEAWAHAVTTRLILNGVDQHRQCTLIKSPRLPTGYATFQILDCGVRGADHHSYQGAKRQRTPDQQQ